MRGGTFEHSKREIHDSYILLQRVESATRRIYELNLCQFSLNNVIGTTKLTLNAREIDSKWEAIWLFSIDSRKSESTSHDKLELDKIKGFFGSFSSFSVLLCVTKLENFSRRLSSSNLLVWAHENDGLCALSSPAVLIKRRKLKQWKRYEKVLAEISIGFSIVTQ